MMDQKAKFEKKMGICAEFIGEAQDSQVARDNVIAGIIQLFIMWYS